MSKLRNFKLVWYRGDETGTVCQPAENSQRARIVFLGKHPDMDRVVVARDEPKTGNGRKLESNFYAVGLAILATEIRMNGFPKEQ